MLIHGDRVNTKKISKLERHTYMDESGEIKQDSKIETFSIPAEPPYVKLLHRRHCDDSWFVKISK